MSVVSQFTLRNPLQIMWNNGTLCESGSSTTGLSQSGGAANTSTNQTAPQDYQPIRRCTPEHQPIRRHLNQSDAVASRNLNQRSPQLRWYYSLLQDLQNETTKVPELATVPPRNLPANQIAAKRMRPMATQHENIGPIRFLRGGVSSPLTFERQVELTSSPWTGLKRQIHRHTLWRPDIALNWGGGGKGGRGLVPDQAGNWARPPVGGALRGQDRSYKGVCNYSMYGCPLSALIFLYSISV